MPSITRLNSQAEALAQFKQFTDFAKTSGGTGGRTVVQVGSQLGAAGNGAFASISAKSRLDFIGNIGRRKQSKDENDDVRDLFKEAVVKMCGCANEQHLPETVKTAMKLEDFDKGKPLTARRILAVQTAVKQHELETAIEAALGISLSANKALKERINTAVAACGGDEDAFAVLQQTWKTILFTNGDDLIGPFAQTDPVPRANRAISSKVSALVSDIQSLRKITGGDQALFDAAKPFLAFKDDKHPLSNSLLTSIVSSVQQLHRLHFRPLADLHANPSTEGVYEASLELHDMINSVMASSGLGPGPAYLQMARGDYREQLIASMIIARAIPQASDLDSAQRNMHADPTRMLRNFYGQILEEGMEMTKNGRLDTLSLDRLNDFCRHLDCALTTLARTVDQMKNGIMSDLQPLGKLDDGFFKSQARHTRMGVKADQRIRHDISAQLPAYARTRARPAV